MKTLPAVLTMMAVATAAAALIVGLGRLGSGEPVAPQAVSAATAAPEGIPPPWQVQVLANDSIGVMGIRVGQSTLGDAVQTYGPDTQIAVIAAQGEPGHLEAYVDPVHADFVTGKLVIAAQATAEQIEGWRARAVKAEFMESTTRRFVLSTNDLVEALKARVVGLSFIPQAQLDTKAVIARFGEPAERLQVTPDGEHLLYPSQGVDVWVDAKGKELIQYVTPAEFDARLRQPLLKAAAELKPARTP